MSELVLNFWRGVLIAAKSSVILLILLYSVAGGVEAPRTILGLEYIARGLSRYYRESFLRIKSITIAGVCDIPLWAILLYYRL